MKLAPLKQRLSSRALVWLCVAALLLSLLPLYTLSFYNHASYGDLDGSLLTHEAWRDSQSWLDTIAAAMRSTAGSRQTTGGTYAATFISSLHPAVSGEHLYWLTTLILLSFFLLSLYFFLRQALVRVLQTDAPTYWMAFCCVAFVMIQFVPELSEAFFWFNGGVAYTLMWSLMILRLGVWIRLVYARTRLGRIAMEAALALLTVIVGGAKYTTLLFALLVEALITVWSFAKKRDYRWYALAMLILMTACCLFSALAPGNRLQNVFLSDEFSMSNAVVQSFKLGFQLMGNWFSLPLLVVWALVAWQLSEALHGCPFRFSHPIWITILSVCLFCAQIIPAVYSGDFLADGRTLNTFFYTFVLMGCALVMYWMGWVGRMREKRGAFAAIGTAQKDWVRIAAFALAVVLGVVGCIMYRPNRETERGVQNLSSVSALQSLLSGEAQAFDEAMDERNAALNDPAQPEVILETIRDIPDAFMGDALETEELEKILRLYGEYYEKQRVTVAQDE